MNIPRHNQGGESAKGSRPNLELLDHLRNMPAEERSSFFDELVTTFMIADAEENIDRGALPFFGAN